MKVTGIVQRGRAVFTLLLILSTFGLAGCRPAGTDSASQRIRKNAAKDTVEFVDDLDRTVRIPQQIKRIVSLSPAATETLFAIGAGERVVGVTTFDDYPSDVAKLPRVGGFVTESLSIERIVELRPDLVISAGSLQKGLVDQLEKLDVPTIAFEPNSVDEISNVVRRMGIVVDLKANADEVADELGRRIALLEQKLMGVDRPGVYYEIADRPLMAAGPKSFIGELLNRAGGRNIFHDTPQAYPCINGEEVVRRSPQIILVSDRSGAADRVLNRPGWQLVDAIRNKRVMTIDENSVFRAGPRVVDGLELIAKAIHPDRFLAESR